MGVRNILLTFYYFREKLLSRKDRNEALRFIDKLRYAQKQGYRFMLDSGAFTYRTAQTSGKADLPPVDEYYRQYKDFILEHGDIFDVIVEMDVEDQAYKADRTLITLDEIDDWAYDLMDTPDIGWRVMQIYHARRGTPWFRRALSNVRSPYLGIGSGMPNYGEIASTIAICREWGKATHGFAMTKVKTDMKYLRDFFSVDSTTWLRADKFGGTTIFDNDQFYVFDSSRKHERRRFRYWYEKWGLDVDRILADDLNENRLATIIAWRELANHHERAWLTRDGRYPYMYRMALNAELPETHPQIVLEKLRRKGVTL